MPKKIYDFRHAFSAHHAIGDMLIGLFGLGCFYYAIFGSIEPNKIPFTIIGAIFIILVNLRGNNDRLEEIKQILNVKE